MVIPVIIEITDLPTSTITATNTIPVVNGQLHLKTSNNCTLFWQNCLAYCLANGFCLFIVIILLILLHIL